MQTLLVYGLIAGLFSLAGGLVVLWKSKLAHKHINILVSIGAGAFLGAVFLDILPEAIEMVGEPHPVLMAALAGFTAYFILERVVMVCFKGRGSHDHSEHTESLPILLILGDSVHNFLDGIVIALAYAANPALGLSAALAIAAHEIPQEIGDFSILLKLGFKKAQVLGINVAQSLLTVPGVFLGYYLGQAIEPLLPLFLGGAAGIFTYIAASDLIPELHHTAGHKEFFRIITPFIFSVAAIYFLTGLAHGH